MTWCGLVRASLRSLIALPSYSFCVSCVLVERLLKSWVYRAQLTRVENLENIDVALIEKAGQRIDIAAYVLTDWPVIAALIRAAERGVRVRVYLGAKQFGGEQTVPLLHELTSVPGVEVRFKHAGSPLMHLKSYQIDGRWLRTGAANFSASGLKRQDNDLLVIDSAAAASAFEKRFEAMFAQGEVLPSEAGGASPVNAAGLLLCLGPPL
jgi:phosphatidylserine/phosphatidylglycerophosphate/cardiolipin synthase-like enzyme